MANQPTSYEPIPPADKKFIAAATERIRLRMKRTAEDIVAIGTDLIEVKKRVNHGQFGFWLENEFEMDERNAQRFMLVAERFGGRSDILSDFKPSILYALAAPSTSNDVIQQAQAKAADGQKVTVADIKKWKSKANAAEKSAKESEKARIGAETRLAEESVAQAEEIFRLRKENRKLQRSLHEALRPEPAQIPDPVTPPADVEIFVPQHPPPFPGQAAADPADATAG